MCVKYNSQFNLKNLAFTNTRINSVIIFTNYNDPCSDQLPSFVVFGLPSINVRPFTISLLEVLIIIVICKIMNANKQKKLNSKIFKDHSFALYARLPTLITISSFDTSNAKIAIFGNVQNASLLNMTKKQFYKILYSIVKFGRTVKR